MRGIAYVLALLLAGAAAPAATLQPAQNEVEAAELALQSLDVDRLFTDAEYAGITADQLTILQGAQGVPEALRLARQHVLVWALTGAGRHDLAEAAGEALLRMQPSEPRAFEGALYAAARAERWARYVALVERAAAAFGSGPERAQLFEYLSPEVIGFNLNRMRLSSDRASPARLAEILLRAGWPGSGRQPAEADPLRILLIDRALDRDDARAAAALAAEVRGLREVLELVTDRRYDRLSARTDRLARVRAAIAAADAASRQWLTAAPEDHRRMLQRVTFLRALGRDAEVLDLLLPLMGDIRVVVAGHEDGYWLVNEAAYALFATGAQGEALELMRPLADMDHDRPELISTSINRLGMLWQAGRHEEALAEADRLMAGPARFASDYGKMWIWANALCAATDLRRADAAAAWRRRMDEKAETNRSAMMQALLCQGDEEGAESVLLAALADEDDRPRAILWLQDYEPPRVADGAERLRAGFARLRRRPAVEAAFAAVAHRLRLPLPPGIFGWP